MHIIIMPPQPIIMGMPICIMFIMLSQHFMNMSFIAGSIGIISQVTTLFRIKRWKECTSCKICERTCEWGAIRGPEIVRSECVRCDDCERLYDDQQKCVHWVVIHRKSKGLHVGSKFS